MKSLLVYALCLKTTDQGKCRALLCCYLITVIQDTFSTTKLLTRSTSSFSKSVWSPDYRDTLKIAWATLAKTNTPPASITGQMLPGVPGKVTVDVSQDLHEVRVDGGEADTGSFSHVDGALLCQIHVVEVDELKLGLLLWPGQTKHSNKRNIIH